MTVGPRPRLLVLAALVLLTVGGAVAVGWFLSAAPSMRRVDVQVLAQTILALLPLTLWSIGVRFVRWQYLLRRVGIRVPIRRSASIYLASLWGIATPAYLGETVRAALLRRWTGAPVAVTLGLWLFDHLLDAAALVLLIMGAHAAGVFQTSVTGQSYNVAVIVALTALLGGVWLMKRGSARDWTAHVGALRTAADLRNTTLPVALLLSLFAWIPATLMLPVAVAGVGGTVSWPAAMATFAEGTMLGAGSLLPAGVGTAGSYFIVRLTALGLSEQSATIVTTLVRVATIGPAVALGLWFFVRDLRMLRGTETVAPLHFDQIAGEYIGQFPPHIWTTLLRRKTDMLAAAIDETIRANAGAPPRGLDLGCGLGMQAIALRERGFDVVGLDAAHELVRRAHASGVSAIVASATALPLRNDSLDFVYTVGTLHHLPSRTAQRDAVADIARVLRPGGVLLVHETNPRNPLFRFYMGYAFPLLRQIDEGTELWLDPMQWKDAPRLALTSIRYSTFLPDFLPRMLLRLTLPIERLLERSNIRSYSVHYLAVLQRSPDTSPKPAGIGTRHGTAAPAGPRRSARSTTGEP